MKRAKKPAETEKKNGRKNKNAGSGEGGGATIDDNNNQFGAPIEKEKSVSVEATPTENLESNVPGKHYFLKMFFFISYVFDIFVNLINLKYFY